MNRDQVFANVRSFSNKIGGVVRGMGNAASTDCPWCKTSASLEFDLDTGKCHCSGCGKNSDIYGLLNEFKFRYVKAQEVEPNDTNPYQRTVICPKCKDSGWLIDIHPGRIEYARPCICDKGKQHGDFKAVDEAYAREYEKAIVEEQKRTALLYHINHEDIRRIGHHMDDSSMSDGYKGLNEKERKQVRALVMEFYFGGNKE